MNKTFKQIISLLLVMCMSFGLFTAAFASEEPKKDVVPTILIHGIAQVNTFLWEDEDATIPLIGEDGTQVTGWPITVDTKELILGVVFPILLTLITQKDYASEACYEAICKALKYNSAKPDGTPTYTTTVDRYYCPVSEMPEEARQKVYNAIPINDYADAVGEENVYFFAYNSTGNVVQLAQELNDFIEMVKKQRGVDKVNLAPVSMGGTIVTAWLEMYSGKYDLYYDNYDSVHKIVFVIAAVDGSNIVGELATNETLLADREFLYNRILPELLGETWTSYLLNIVLRILPEDVLQSILQGILKGAVDTILGNNTLLWALVPREYFDEAFEKHFKDKGPEYDALKTEIKLYNTAQKNLQQNLNRITDKDHNAIVHAISAYGLKLYPIGVTSKTINSDTIIHSASTSLQATFSDFDKTLPADYAAKNPVCTDKTHNHISPDKQVDASTSYLPENTWFVQGLNHEDTGDADSVIKFVSILLIDDTIKDVHSDPVNYPQFNGSRTTKQLKRDFIPVAERFLEENPNADAALREEMQEALDDCKAMLNETVVDTKTSQERIDRLEWALINAGLRGAPEEETDSEKVLLKIFKALSDLSYKSLVSGK